MNDKSSLIKLDFKSSYDGSVESECDFDLANESMDSNCTIQSNYYQKVILNKAEEKQTFLNEFSSDKVSGDLQAEFDLINKRFYLQQIECIYIYFFL